MSSKTNIEWADMVWNPVTGCTKVSEGCQHCYAEKMVKRLRRMPLTAQKYKNGFKVTCHTDELNRKFPSRSRKKIFVCSMGDLFHKDVEDEFIDKVIEKILNHTQHIFIVLTKRPERMCQYFNDIAENKNECISGRMMQKRSMRNYSAIHGHMLQARQGKPFQNLWLGVSVENQKTAYARIPLLLDTPAAKRIVSIEPMLDEIELTEPGFNEGEEGHYLELRCPACGCDDPKYAQWSADPDNMLYCEGCEGTYAADLFERHINWVICGGESGPSARPIDADWVSNMQYQCENAKVPFYFKQWGGRTPKKNGRLLDGKTYQEMPDAIAEAK